jgi:putative hydrolase of the HAD superfamily
VPLTVDPTTVDAVLFDMGGIFFLPHHQRIRDALVAAGLPAPDNPLAYHRAHYEAAYRYDTSTDDAADWFHYYDGYVEGVRIDGAAPDAVASAMEPAWRDPADHHWTWPQPEAIRTLEQLSDAGYALAIVSNCDGTAASSLAAGGVCQVGPGSAVEVTAIIDSEIIGISKPDPAIFAPALSAVGMAAERCIYVGDTVLNDVAGARNAGLHPVHLDPYGLYVDAGFDHDRIVSMSELSAHLL